jgi:hypothetical protein
MTKLRKVAGEPYWKEEAEVEAGEPRLIAGKWKLKSNQIRFALGTGRSMTDEQRQAASERMKRIHQKQYNGGIIHENRSKSIVQGLQRG